jgi:hypothetical protein
MSPKADSVRGYAAKVAEERLIKANRRLRALGSVERRAVERLAHDVAARVADQLLEEAARNAAMASALTAVGRSATTPVSFAPEVSEKGERIPSSAESTSSTRSTRG